MFSATDRNKALYIGELFKRVFNISSPIYIPWGKGEYYEADKFPEIATREPADAKLLSWMGTPVVNSFVLKGGKYQYYNFNGQLEDIVMNDFVMPYATLVDFSQAKNLTQTRTCGSYGTVKEMYGFDDYQIDIRGFCLNDGSRGLQKLAKEQIWAIESWNSLASSIEIEGDFFGYKGINNIVIMDVKTRAVQGKPDVISFEIQAISDTAIELIDIL